MLVNLREKTQELNETVMGILLKVLMLNAVGKVPYTITFYSPQGLSEHLRDREVKTFTLFKYQAECKSVKQG